MKLNGIITAAGLSSRMGAGNFKPMMPLQGKTVIQCSVDSMIRAGVSEIVVVVGHRREEIEYALSGEKKVSCVWNEEYASSDMLCSIKKGLRVLEPCDAFYILPGDMPMIRKETYLALKDKMQQTGAEMVFPLYQGKKKHPPLICSSMIAKILEYDGLDGLRGLWRQCVKEHAEYIEITDEGCLIDIDTMTDYNRLSQL